MAESIVEINGHFYRYEYEPESGKTLYKGPVGDAPALTQAEFERTIIPSQEQESVSTVSVKRVITVSKEGQFVKFLTHQGQEITLSREDVPEKAMWDKVMALKAGDVVKMTGDPLGDADVEILKTRKRPPTIVVRRRETEAEAEREKIRRELELEIRKQQQERDKDLDELEEMLQKNLAEMEQILDDTKEAVEDISEDED
jgi:hypothetical protein